MGDLQTAKQDAGQAPASITVRAAGSRCTVNSAAGVITFRVALHNRETFDFETTLRPLVTFSDGGAVSTSTYDKLVSVAASSGRTVELVIAYKPARHKPTACRVHVRDADSVRIAMRHSNIMA